jgi:hypothetical protein
MQLMASQKMVADLQQQIAALTLNLNHQTDVQKLKEEGATRRKLMDVTSRAFNTETINEAKVNQDILRATSDQKPHRAGRHHQAAAQRHGCSGYPGRD